MATLQVLSGGDSRVLTRTRTGQIGDAGMCVIEYMFVEQGGKG